MNSEISNAVDALRNGGVIAYPTEYCFGLGCDPRNERALERLLTIKQRNKRQGVILIASTYEQVSDYACLESLPLVERVKASWPGPNTWILPAKDDVSSWVRGQHTSIAMRISAHDVCNQLCQQFDHAIVSTSAMRDQFSEELDYIVGLEVGGAEHASTIRDAISGEQLR